MDWFLYDNGPRLERVKLMKEFCDLFSEFTYKSISHCMTEGNFIADSKRVKFVHFTKAMEEQINQTNDQIFQKYMKDAFIVNCNITSIKIFFQNTNIPLVKASILSMFFRHDRKNKLKL